MQGTAEREATVANTPTDVIPVAATERVVHADPEPRETWEQLPGGVVRVVRVDRDELFNEEAVPFKVTTGDETIKCLVVRIEGPCELLTAPGYARGCGPRHTAHIETTAPLSVRVK